jgi:hypothetical protein
MVIKKSNDNYNEKLKKYKFKSNLILSLVIILSLLLVLTLISYKIEVTKIGFGYTSLNLKINDKLIVSNLDDSNNVIINSDFIDFNKIILTKKEISDLINSYSLNDYLYSNKVYSIIYIDSNNLPDENLSFYVNFNTKWYDQKKLNYDIINWYQLNPDKTYQKGFLEITSFHREQNSFGFSVEPINQSFIFISSDLNKFEKIYLFLLERLLLFISILLFLLIIILVIIKIKLNKEKKEELEREKSKYNNYNSYQY